MRCDRQGVEAGRANAAAWERGDLSPLSPSATGCGWPRSEKAPTKRRASTRAFTLAEVLAALVFMAIVIPVSVHALQVASRAGQIAQRKTIAARVGERVLNEITATHQYASTSQRGTATEGPYEFRYVTRLQPWERDAMRLLSVEVTFTAQGQEYVVRLSTLVGTTAL